MSQKRIVIFGYAGSTHVYKWSKALSARGYDIRVISLGNEMIDGVDVVNFPKSGKFSYFKYASQASKSALEFNPDIIHVHFAGGHGLWGLKTNFSPIVVSVWGSDITEAPNSFINKLLVTKILKRATKITTTSQLLLNSTVKFLPSTSKKVSVIPFGVPIPEEIFEFPNDENISAVYLKQLEAVYAPDILIKAVALVTKKFPSFKLTMGGDGSLKSDLIKLINELKLEENVSIIGFYDNKKIYDLIRKHHLLIMPSLKEGFGVAAVEAFACARPVIASNVGGIPEIVTDGLNGFLVSPGNIQELADTIIKMISDKEQMIKMGRSGYESVKSKYDWEKSVDQMEEVYKSL